MKVAKKRHERKQMINHGALPALGTERRIALVAWAAIALLGAAGCTDRSGGSGSFLGVPSFMTTNNENDENALPRATATGRIDFPIGGPDKNRTSDKYQTYSFHVHDWNSDGIPDTNSRLEFIDHRKNAQMNGQDIKLVAVTWSTFVPTAPNSECPDGSVTVTGFADNRATPSYDNLAFTLQVCDVDEPGNQFPNDQFHLNVPGLPPDPDTGESYSMHKHPQETQGAYLTGGNVQVKNTNQ
jgi:hypothetical protein